MTHRRATTRAKVSMILVAMVFGLMACGDDGPVPTPDSSTDSSSDSGDVSTGECTGAADGTACGEAMICVGEACAASECGDSYLDTEAGEVCDDGNSIPGDGCESDCTFSCVADEDCDDMDPCNGVEVCNPTLNRCQAGEPACDDGDPCTADSCDSMTGCANEFIDVDGDSYAPATCTTAGLMGDDCNDTNFAIFPGAAELCDMVDNDCDGTVDNGTVDITCFRDADGDTYGDDADTVVACTCPTDYIARGGDCDDSRADVNPDHTSWERIGYGTPRGFDWDCSGTEEKRWAGLSPGSCTRSGGGGFFRCTGSGWLTSVPACGTPTGLFANNFRNCDTSTGVCAEMLIRQTQECR